MKLCKLVLILALILALAGCAAQEPADIAATTGPVAQFAQAIAAGSGVTVTQVITDSVSCLHDYSLSVRQMEALETSRAVLISGAGLEETMESALKAAETIYDCSAGIPLLEMDGHHHEETEDGHHHDHDPHYWLDPAKAAIMAENIRAALTELYPEQEALFKENCDVLLRDLQDLEAYGREQLSDLSCRELITFHDGFSYFADHFDLHIAAAMEEESGSEASARDLMSLAALIETAGVPAIFTEINGSPSAAAILTAETAVPSYALDMAMGGSVYFDAMIHNIDTLKEALQ